MGNICCRRETYSPNGEDIVENGRCAKSAPPLQSQAMSTAYHSAGDDCAINELLEGRMELDVVLPDGRKVRLTVERRTPMMDLLVQAASATKISPGGHVIHVFGEQGREGGALHYKPSTPIGSLDTNTICIVPKKELVEPPLKRTQRPANRPFEPTFRVQVHLPRNQLTVTRVSPRVKIAELRNMVCQEKGLDIDRYQLVRPNDLAHPLDGDMTLAEYGSTELTLLSNSCIESHICNSTSHIIPYSKRIEEKKKTGILRLLAEDIRHSSTKHYIKSKPDAPLHADLPKAPARFKPKKRRPAPLPPPRGDSTFHSRQSSSDSSGYHDATSSFLHEEEQTPHCGSDAEKASSDSSGVSSLNATSTQASSSATLIAKKRRAPPPPPSGESESFPDCGSFEEVERRDGLEMAMITSENDVTPEAKENGISPDWKVREQMKPLSESASESTNPRITEDVREASKDADSERRNSISSDGIRVKLQDNEDEVGCRRTVTRVALAALNARIEQDVTKQEIASSIEAAFCSLDRPRSRRKERLDGHTGADRPSLLAIKQRRAPVQVHDAVDGQQETRDGQDRDGGVILIESARATVVPDSKPLDGNVGVEECRSKLIASERSDGDKNQAPLAEKTVECQSSLRTSEVYPREKKVPFDENTLRESQSKPSVPVSSLEEKVATFGAKTTVVYQSNPKASDSFAGKKKIQLAETTTTLGQSKPEVSDSFFVEKQTPFQEKNTIVYQSKPLVSETSVKENTALDKAAVYQLKPRVSESSPGEKKTPIVVTKTPIFQSAQETLSQSLKRSSSLLNLAESKKQTGQKIGIEVTPKHLQRSLSQLNGTVDNDRQQEFVAEQDRLHREYVKLQQQFVLWQKQLLNNHAMLREERIVPQYARTLRQSHSLPEGVPESPSHQVNYDLSIAQDTQHRSPSLVSRSYSYEPSNDRSCTLPRSTINIPSLEMGPVPMNGSSTLRSSKTKNYFKPPQVRTSTMSRQRLPPEMRNEGDLALDASDDIKMLTTILPSFESLKLITECDTDSVSKTTTDHTSVVSDDVNKRKLQDPISQLRVSPPVPSKPVTVTDQKLLKTTGNVTDSLLQKAVKSEKHLNGHTKGVIEQGSMPPPPPPLPSALSVPNGSVHDASKQSPVSKMTKSKVPGMDPREELMLEIRKFGGRTALRKISLAPCS